MAKVDPARPDDEDLPVLILNERGKFEMAPHGMYLPPADGEEDQRVSDGALRCYLTLRFLGGDGGFKIRHKTLHERMGRGRSTVRAYVDELQKAGWILVYATNRGDDSTSSNRYVNLLTPLTGPDDPRIEGYRPSDAVDA